MNNSRPDEIIITKQYIIYIYIGNNFDTNEIIKNSFKKYLMVNKEIEIKKTDYGKPYFPKFPELKFSVSHTVGIIIVVFSRKEVGIDVEPVRDFSQKLVQRFMSSSEQKYIYSSKNMKNERFAKIWTKKEAYVKYKGKGMSLLLENLDTFELDRKTDFDHIYYKSYIISVCY